MTLFRDEALAHRADRLSGDVFIAVPLTWQAIGYLIFGGLAAALSFLAIASYARVETVEGRIAPDKGVAAIEPTRGGVVTEIHVRDGDTVAKDAVLATIRTEEDQASGMSAAAMAEIAITQQNASLSAQAQSVSAGAVAQQGQIAAQQSGIAAEISQLDAQVGLQRDLIISAQQDYDKAQSIAARGFISGHDLKVREETLLSRRQQLSQLQQAIATRRAALLETQRSATQIVAQARVQSSAIAAAQAELSQRAATTLGSRAYVLRAPISGRVTALTARRGQPASAQAPLMMIVPAHAKLRAELAVPSSAIGFVRTGQEVRLAIDAFPYQRFGTFRGRISTVSQSAVDRRGQNDEMIPTYPVTVTLDQTAIDAFGQVRPLIPGMTLTARIVTERQSLLQWLFEPLFAVRMR